MNPSGRGQFATALSSGGGHSGFLLPESPSDTAAVSHRSRAGTREKLRRAMRQTMHASAACQATDQNKALVQDWNLSRDVAWLVTWAPTPPGTWAHKTYLLHILKRMTAHHVKIPELAAREVAGAAATISSQEKGFH